MKRRLARTYGTARRTVAFQLYVVVRRLWLVVAGKEVELWPYTQDGIPLCESCCAGDLTVEACPNDKGICVYCCPCHKDEFAGPEGPDDLMGASLAGAGVGYSIGEYRGRVKGVSK